MTTPSEPQSEAGVFAAIRTWGITRGDDGFLGGVIDGLAQRVGMATGPARIIVVVAAVFLNGIVLLGYAAAWALLPDRRGNIIVQNFGRGVPNVGALIGIGVICLLGLGGIDNGLTSRAGDFPFDHGGPWRVLAIVFAVVVPLALIAGLIALVVVLARRSGGSTPPDGAPPVYAAMPGQSARTATPEPPSPEPASPDAETPDGAAPDGAAPASSPAADPRAYAGPQVTPVHPAPPAPPLKARVPGPGKGFYLATLAWAMLCGAGVAFAHRQGDLAVSPPVAWFVAFVTGLGVLLVLVSLSGRKLGFLGFVGIMSILPMLVIMGSTGDLRDAFARGDGLIDIDFRLDHEETSQFDASADFAADYRHVVINGTCFNDALVPPPATSTARISELDVTEDTTIDVLSELTYVTVTAGTPITVRGVGDAQARVVWPEREISCHFYGVGGDHVVLGGDDPGLDLVVYDDQYVNTIVITEVTR